MIPDLSDITLVLGLDATHLEELRWVWPTWVRYKPELLSMPAVVFYDPQSLSPERAPFLRPHPSLRWVPWHLEGALSQREVMLSGFLHVPAREVTTRWYLKLDTDAVATGPGEWLQAGWFHPGDTGQAPVLIASAWAYSKPRYVMDLLDDWGDAVPQLRGYPRLNLPYSTRRNFIRHPRIISWFCLADVSWTREIVGYLPPSQRLPYPSQDSYAWYCAQRAGRRILRPDMTQFHWAHRGLPAIRRIVTSLGLQPCQEGLE